jgi:hypothetical protein
VGMPRFIVLRRLAGNCADDIMRVRRCFCLLVAVSVLGVCQADAQTLPWPALSSPQTLLPPCIDLSSCGGPKYEPERRLLQRFGCTAHPAHFSDCSPDDRKCEVASKIRGCVAPDGVFWKKP